MGVLDTLLMLAGLGGAMYMTVYYFIPALNQLNTNYQQPFQQAAAAPAPAPYVEPAPAPYVEPTPEPVADVPVEEPASTTDEVAGIVEDLADIVEGKDEEKKDEPKKKSSSSSSSKSSSSGSKKKSGGTTIENEAAPKKGSGTKLKPGKNVIANEAYHYLEYWYDENEYYG